MQWNYLIGSAIEPIGHNRKIICHVCNDVGVFGAGFALAVANKWPIVKQHYIRWFETKQFAGCPFVLGQTQDVYVGNEVIVCNMIAQRGVGFNNGIAPIRYEALRDCFVDLRERSFRNIEIPKISIHAPRLGTGLAGGDWCEVTKVIELVFKDIDVVVNVYDLPVKYREGAALAA